MRRAGLRAPIAIIPNGVDLLTAPPSRSSRDRRRLLFLGRLHPIKGVDRLLRVWARLEPQFADWDLDIVGPDEGDCGDSLRAEAARLGLARAFFRGPRYGADKSAAYFDADLFVLPTQTENFGMSVAESLSASVPAVVTKGAPWSGLEAHDCGAWVDLDDDALHAALARLMALTPAERDAMGARGRDWMVRDFAWEGIAEKMLAAYAWARGRGGARPDWVHTR